MITFFFHSLAALELSEWRKQHSTTKKNHHYKNKSKNNIDNDNGNKHLNENGNNDNDNNDINDDDNSNEKLNYNLFKIASRQLESTYTLSLDIQEKYGIN